MKTPFISLFHGCVLLLTLNAQGEVNGTTLPPVADPVLSPAGIYTGRLSEYKTLLVMQLSESDGQVVGTYQYVRHGKPLSLKGTWDSASGKGHMIERFNSEQTGEFSFSLLEDKLVGLWKSADQEGREYEFTFNKVGFDPDADPDPNGMTGLYTRSQSNWVWVNDENGEPYKKKFLIQNWVRFEPVTKNRVAFFYQVWGSNGHQGQADGIATWNEKGGASWVQEDGYIPKNGPCRLTFEFKDDQVVVTPVSDCDHLGGARVGLPGGSYRREKDDPVQKLEE